MAAPLRFFRVIVILFIALVARTSHAQETWTTVPSPTAQTLWSVCYGGGQFVAVGEADAISTSPDGQAWTLRNSGFPTRWLVGVGYGNGLFVAVGEGGLILTSPDGATWTARNTAGARINAVAYGNGRFLAVDDTGGRWTSSDGFTWSSGFTERSDGYLRGLAYGSPKFVVSGLNHLSVTYDGLSYATRIFPAPAALEAVAYGRKIFLAAGDRGTAYSSRDGLVWNSQPAVPGAAVRGLAFFNNEFVAVGNDGAISSSFDGASWTPRSSGTTQLLLAVAGSPEAAVAVGTNGTILRSLATPAPPAIVQQPTAVTESRDGNVAFTVVASGALPLSYQWRKNGEPVAGATGDTLFLSGITATAAGAYSVIVTNAAGSVTSTPATLAVVDAFPSIDVVDASFVVNGLNQPPRATAILPGGKILIGGRFVLLNEGVAEFAVARLNGDGSVDPTFRPAAVDSAGSVTALCPLPDGKILIGGSFSTVGGIAYQNLARLNPDGSLDTAFPSRTTAAFASTPQQLLLTADGKILVVDGSMFLTRLTSDGANDPTFIQSTIPAARSLALIQSADLQSDGRIVVAGTTPNVTLRNAVIARLNADGSIDSSFAGQTLLNFNEIKALRVLADGRVMVAMNAFSSLNFSVQRYLANGMPDPAFVLFLGPQWLTSAAFTKEGKTWLSSGWTTGNLAGQNQIVRLDTEGALDPAFHLSGSFSTSSGSAASASSLTPLDDGRLLLGGDFSQIGPFLRANFARLNATASGGPNPPRILSIEPSFVSTHPGEPFSVSVLATGSALLLYSSFGPGGSAIAGPVTVNTTTVTGVYGVTVTANSGVRGSASATYFVQVGPNGPAIVKQPVAVQSPAGRVVTLSVSVTGAPPISYQWFKNGSPIPGPGAMSAVYTFESASLGDRGEYSVVIRDSLGVATSDSVHVGVDEISRLGAISTRAFVGTDERVTIAGFVISGNTIKRVLIRGAGPALAARFGLANTLPVPLLSVWDSTGRELASAAGWTTVPAAEMDALGLFKFDPNSNDAAMLADLPPGNYTARLSGLTDNATGIGLIEIYEADNRAERLTAISTRAFVGTGDALAIPGISVNGPVPKKILVRAVGPTLASLGVSAPLADPVLTLVNFNTGETLASNDDWSASANKADIVAASAAAGEFPLPDPSKDAVLLITVPPGLYTALIRGKNGGTGVALVEVYEVP